MDGKVFGILLAGLLIGGLLGYGLAPRGVSQVEFQSVEKKATDLQNQLSDLQGKVQGYENQINQLQSELSKYKAKTTTLEGKNYTVMVAYDEKVGYYLTDGEGRTIYYFAKDIPNSGKSSCYGACAEKWPVFYTDKIILPQGLNASDFSVITREDGKKQLAYKGWPLYYFFKDEKPGDIYGEGVKGVWFVMKPDYTVMLAYKEGIGTYFVDSRGMAIYYFAKDVNGTSVCYGACAEKWPVFSPNHFSAPSTLDQKDFSYIERGDGTYQLTYKGWPLYYFIKDEKAGDTKGEDVKHVWYVMRDYDVMIAYQEGLGTYLTDDYGKTLYYFAKDSVNQSACTGECLEKWPPFYRPNPVAPSVIQGYFGELNVNGIKFTTFKGYPLYYFFKDERRGEVNGQGVKNVWFAVNPFNFR